MVGFCCVCAAARADAGYNTRWALLGLDVAFGAFITAPGRQSRGCGDNLALVTVFFGANDASLREHNPRQHVPLTEYKDNLREIVARVRALTPGA
jgi:hypothetical protein